MTESDAFEVVGLIKAATAGRVEQSTLDYYSAALRGLDYNTALSAATIGTITWRKFPSWAEFKEVYRAQERLARPPENQLPPKEEVSDESFKRGSHIAEWVHVYYWCRMIREPRTLESFPQQEGHVDPSSIMSQERYKELRDEWKNAGSPKFAKPIPMAR